MGRKTETKSFLVCDALSQFTGEMQSLQEEMQSWYDNMPESLQGGDKGCAVEEAASTLDEPANITIHEALENSTDSNYKPLPGGLRFDYPVWTRKKLSRADRRSEACGLARAALDRVAEWMEEERKVLDAETMSDSTERGDLFDAVEDAVQEIESAIDAAEGVEFPGAYG